MPVRSLGHAVLKVRNQQVAEQFYNGVLGIPICARYDENGMKMSFFTLGHHHDFAVMEVSGEGSTQSESAVGLHHVAFKIGSNLDELRDAKAKLEQAGIKPTAIDHEVTKSLYFADPDGNGVELFVDVSDVWRRDPQRVAQIAPLAL